MDAAAISALASLISAIAWPSLVLLFLLLHRGTIDRLLGNLEELSLPGGIEAKLRKAVEREAAAVQRDPQAARAITEDQVKAADRVEQVAVRGDLDLVRQQVRRLALEYEAVRASLPSGDERTRKMEKIVTTMRTLASAAQPLISELVGSDSPGLRLAAIAVLQLKPRSDFYTWLADRFREERAFVGYHAGVALLSAVRLAPKSDSTALESAVRQAQSSLPEHLRGSDRFRILQEALDELQRG